MDRESWLGLAGHGTAGVEPSEDSDFIQEVSANRGLFSALEKLGR
jgi:hypothetical protein